MENIYSSKNSIKGMKRQATEWMIIFAKYISNKELVSKSI